MLLSIGMMVKNESKRLDECLASLNPILNNIDSELIIVDTGSEDTTVEIARKYTNKVFFHKWNDNFSEMRNKVISYCLGEWIMVIDGDEILENPNEIINFIKSKDRTKINTVLLSVKNLTDEKDLSSYSILNSPRIFKNDKDFRYEGVIHNQPIFKTPIIKLNAKLLHYGYIATDKELMERKFIRTATLLEKELKNQPHNFYYWCQLSISYSMHNEYEKALEYSINAYKILKNSNLNLDEYIYVYMQLAYSYLINKNYGKTIEICLEGIKLKNGILDLYFYLAKAQIMTSDYTNSIKNYKEYLELAKNFHQYTNTNISLYTLGKQEYVYNDLVIAFKEIKDYEKALEYCKKITHENLITLNLSNIVYLSLKTKNYNYLCEYYEKNIFRLGVYDIFNGLIESYQKDLCYEEKIQIAKALKNIKGLYGVLNNVRYAISSNKKMNFDISDYLESNVDIYNLPDYYGDFLYYLILHKIDLYKFLINIRELEFNRFFIYLKDRYDDFGEKILLYLEEIEFKEDNSYYKVKKALERYCILSANLNDEDFFKLFNQYIKDGTKYINKIYSKDIIINESIYELKNEEEAYLLYMYKANLVKESDEKSYIKYLRKALRIYPYMRRGIEFLVNEFNNKLNTERDELEKYKIQIKSDIKSLIQNNKLEDAKCIILQYEEIIKNDVEIVLFKSEIALKQTKVSNYLN